MIAGWHKPLVLAENKPIVSVGAIVCKFLQPVACASRLPFPKDQVRTYVCYLVRNINRRARSSAAAARAKINEVQTPTC